ncbi:hypothetical protein N665_0383s0206 [Sinapis alba]|nr:hypothetical protein N665_0383s0206 [Sinapis alba]
MDNLDFPPRQFTLEQEPVPIKSSGYYKALKPDEWEKLRNSRLEVFIRFQELEFGWASTLSLIGVRPVRFSLNEFEGIIGLNCEYVMNIDHPVVEVTDEMKVFWGQMGVNFEHGPSIEKLTAACKMSRTWSRDDRKCLGYLAIYSSFIEAQRTLKPTRASMARLVMDLRLLKIIRGKSFIEVLLVWIYNALHEYTAGFGDSVPGRPTPPLLAFLGGKGRKNAKEKLQIHSCLNNYVVKDYSEIFPLWDDDVAD